MCEKAVEIQRLKKPRNGDFVIFEMNRIDILYDCNNSAWSLDYLWLLRQDQLQKMYLEFKKEEIEREANEGDDKEFALKALLSNTVSNFHYFVNPNTEFGREYPQGNGGWLIFNSMEQLWLAFVMKELYQKMWNGKDWVKE